MRKPKFKKNELVKINGYGVPAHGPSLTRTLAGQYGIILSVNPPGLGYSVYLQNGTSYLFYENELEKLTQ